MINKGFSGGSYQKISTMTNVLGIILTVRNWTKNVIFFLHAQINSCAINFPVHIHVIACQKLTVEPRSTGKTLGSLRLKMCRRSAWKLLICAAFPHAAYCNSCIVFKI